MKDYTYYPYFLGNQYEEDIRPIEPSFRTGFMFDRLVTRPDDEELNPRLISCFRKKSDSELRSLIEDSLKASEYKCLTSTTYNSSKKQIIMFRDVLTKLIDAGVFDYVPYETAPLSEFMNPAQQVTSNKTVDDDALQILKRMPTTLSVERNDKPVEVSLIEENNDDGLHVDMPTKTNDRNITAYEDSYIEVIIKPDRDSFAKILEITNEEFVGRVDFIENNVVVSAIDRLLQISITLCLEDILYEKEVFCRLDSLIKKLPRGIVKIIRFRTTKTDKFSMFEDKCKKQLPNMTILTTSGKWGIIAFTVATGSDVTIDEIMNAINLSKEYYDENK